MSDKPKITEEDMKRSLTARLGEVPINMSANESII